MYLEWGAKGPPEESAGSPKWGQERPRRYPWSKKGDIELTMVFTCSGAPRRVGLGAGMAPRSDIEVASVRGSHRDPTNAPDGLRKGSLNGPKSVAKT